jgi:excinuclease UvrABC helicase subunit UvrB
MYSHNKKQSIAMVDAIDETNRRRAIQHTYNIQKNITPTTILSSIKEIGIPSKKKSAFEGNNVI